MEMTFRNKSNTIKIETIKYAPGDAEFEYSVGIYKRKNKKSDWNKIGTLLTNNDKDVIKLGAKNKIKIRRTVI